MFEGRKGSGLPPYRLGATNFGPIGQASIDVRPLTVFVGRSNTGKSYLAMLAYVLNRCFAARRSGYRDLEQWPITTSARAAVTPDDSVWEAMDQWIDSMSGAPYLRRLPTTVEAFIRRFLKRTQDYDVTLDLHRCFGIQELSQLIRQPNSKSARIALDLPDWRRPFRYEFEPRRDGTLSTSGPVTEHDSLLEHISDSEQPGPLLRLVIRAVIERQASGSRDKSELADLLDHLVDLAHRSWLCPFPRRAHYLPADRTGLIHSHGVIASALVQSAATAGLRPAVEVPLLSGVLVDFLSRLIGMANGSGAQGGAATGSIADRIEETILGGRVRADESKSNYPRFAYQPDGWSMDLSLSRASSMVSELAPIVLYLRHVVRPGDLLIIDEPESHLHPGIQVKLIRQLAEAVGKGVHILLTTHSEWVLEELSNIVLASALTEEQRETAGLDCALRPEDVGVWMFRVGDWSEGSSVSEITLDESRLYSSSFDEVAANTHNDWARIADLAEREQ